MSDGHGVSGWHARGQRQRASAIGLRIGSARARSNPRSHRVTHLFATWLMSGPRSATKPVAYGLNAVQQLASLGSRASFGTGADALAGGAALADVAALADAAASALGVGLVGAGEEDTAGAELAVAGDALSAASALRSAGGSAGFGSHAHTTSEKTMSPRVRSRRRKATRPYQPLPTGTTQGRPGRASGRGRAALPSDSMTSPVAPTGTPYREPWRPPPPPLPPLVGLALGALLAGALAAFTSNKLLVMAKLRGDIEGIPERELVLSRELLRYKEKSAVYALVDPNDPDAQPYRIQIQRDRIGNYRYGEIVKVRCLESERQCYMPGSVYIDDSNRSFDIGLLAIELGALAGCTWAGVRRWRAWRRLASAVSGRAK